MTYKEREKQLCFDCKESEHCAWAKTKRYANCLYCQELMSGWELGQQDTLEEIEKVLTKEFYRINPSTIKQIINELKQQ